MRRLIGGAIAIAAIAAGFVPTTSASAAPGADGSYCSVSLPEQTWVCADSPSELSLAEGSEVHTDATQYLIARLYDNADYDTSAGYLNIYAAGDCTASESNVDYSIGDLSTWSSRVSSFESFGDCATRLWSGTNFTDTAYPGSSSYLVDSSYVGAAFNDKAQSAQFS